MSRDGTEMVTLDAAVQMIEKKSSGQGVNDNKHKEERKSKNSEQILHSQSLQLGIVGNVTILNNSD